MNKANQYFLNVKKKIPCAILAGFTPGMMFFFFGIIDIFGNNRDEFMFKFGDFGLTIFMIALAAGLIFAALIAFLPGYASSVVFGIAVWLSVMGYIQSIAFNGSGALRADTGATESGALDAVDLAVWIITLVMFVTAAVLIKKFDVLKNAFVIALIAICVIMLTGCIMQIGNIIQEPDSSADDVLPPETKEAYAKNSYLSSRGLTEVSESGNVIIFLIDRFDVNYYKEAVEQQPAFFDGLDGFTYFSDNISLYSRTYPAVATMITGVDNDFSQNAENYFHNAYTGSPFLKDLAANNYKIKIYSQKYYAYRTGEPLVGIADNLSITSAYKIANKNRLINNLISLSAYRYLPNVFKSRLNISTASFYGIVEAEGNDPIFETDDANTCRQILDSKLTFDGNEKSYIFIHLSGCHDPYSIDENAEPVNNSDVISHLSGCFKMIYKYIDDLKELGVYDKSTIIITGDHPSAISDSDIPSQTRLTALFVKPAGVRGELAYSSAEVSQENLIPTIISSAGISTDNDYGLSYFEIPENENRKRYHKFELYIGEKDTQIVTLEVTGDGTDFNNWNVFSTENIGELYN